MLVKYWWLEFCALNFELCALHFCGARVTHDAQSTEIKYEVQALNETQTPPSPCSHTLCRARLAAGTAEELSARTDREHLNRAKYLYRGTGNLPRRSNS